MAYASLVSLAQLLEQIQDRHQHAFEKQQIESLLEKITRLTTFLDDFPTEAVKLEARITVAANQAEDTLGNHILHKNGSKGLSYVFYFLRQLLNNNFRKLLKEIDSILKEAVQIKSSSVSENQIPSDSSGSLSQRLPRKGKDTVMGFEEDLLKIKGRLCGNPCLKLEVIPIVGMGGIGKTTLARYAYDDPLSVYKFEVRAWVTVSQNYDINRILICLLNSFDASKKGEFTFSSGTQSLVQRVYQYLKGRRYLIVIDDVWNSNVWDDVRRVFPDDLNGSRIIITTRDLDVASYVDSSINAHEMHLMGVDESWRLLKEKVFGEEVCPLELEKIGKQIAEKCRGLPLAIVVIAGVLCKVNQMQDTWRSIERNVNEAVNTSNEPFSEILSLSYTCLPHHLRPCFLYMGVFVEDEEISVSQLIKLWVAEGFLKGSKDLEEVGEDYLEDLAKRSLVLISKKRYNGRIKTIKIHDLLRDLCLRKARDEKFLHVISKFSGKFPGGIENSRRLCIFSNMRRGFPDMDGSRIRTILLPSSWDFDCWKSFRLLKVVHAMSVSCLDGIGELLHLRYLAVTLDIEVPESFSKLENLQTLIIRSYCPLFLPIGIWRMSQLRHVIMSDGFLPDPDTETCDKIVALKNLHTLKGVRGFTCSERMLELISNVNKLGISYLFESDWSMFCLNNLVNLHKLEKLNLYADLHEYSESNLSKNIAFPVTLRKLTLRGSGIPWEDMSIVGTLPNLQVLKLKLHACRGNKWETREGEFCELKLLLVESTDLLHWITESSHFPRLERLLLHNCPSLKEIPDCIGEIPTLQVIEVDRCDSSVQDSAKYIEEEQLSLGNDLQVDLKSSFDWQYYTYDIGSSSSIFA